MTDCVVTVPMGRWAEWLDEGALPGDECPDDVEYHYYCAGAEPDIQPGDRVYIVAHGRLRGWAPLVRLEWVDWRSWAFVRRGNAVACTIPEFIQGFRGWRYRFWSRDEEIPFPEWRKP